MAHQVVANLSLVLPVGRGTVDEQEDSVHSLLMEQKWLTIDVAQLSLRLWTRVKGSGEMASYWLVDKLQLNNELNQFVYRNHHVLRCFLIATGRETSDIEVSLSPLSPETEILSLTVPLELGVTKQSSIGSEDNSDHERSGNGLTLEPKLLPDDLIDLSISVAHGLRRCSTIFMICLPKSEVSTMANAREISHIQVFFILPKALTQSKSPEKQGLSETQEVFLSSSPTGSKIVKTSEQQPVKETCTGSKKVKPSEQQPVHENMTVCSGAEHTTSVKCNAKTSFASATLSQNEDKNSKVQSFTSTTDTGKQLQPPVKPCAATKEERSESTQEPGIKKAARSGWGSKNRARNNNRSSIFIEFLQNTYGREYLDSGTGIIDVAGGKGEVSFKLVVYGNHKSTIVDPRPCDVTKLLSLLTKKQIERFSRRATTIKDSIKKFTLPVPEHCRCYFEHPLAEVPAYSQENIKSHYVNDENVSNAAHTKILQERIKGASIVIGMHPDQATEAIVDCALEMGKPFAVIPCCVFPQLFPERTARGVHSHKQFCEYLQQKDPSKIRLGKLNFAGRSDVVYSL